MSLRKEILSVVIIVAVAACLWFLVDAMGEKQGGAQTQFVYDAVHSAALTCYAVEGAYPASLDYLRENYGLAYDESRYMVSYYAFASNLLPEIFVVEVGGDG